MASLSLTDEGNIPLIIRFRKKMRTVSESTFWDILVSNPIIADRRAQEKKHLPPVSVAKYRTIFNECILGFFPHRIINVANAWLIIHVRKKISKRKE
ncbi:hypothetical protein PR048_027606 [Dryococelus australis]|uniref:Uncharacterized protein n=1 Tax=Dryococelus australis TaxID=614101 RepID=A0ABQ9GH03_9NEOP|nr:hypothetical protein PR048_027606 [Dryococelus australis]